MERLHTIGCWGNVGRVTNTGHGSVGPPEGAGRDEDEEGVGGWGGDVEVPQELVGELAAGRRQARGEGRGVRRVVFGIMLMGRRPSESRFAAISCGSPLCSPAAERVLWRARGT